MTISIPDRYLCPISQAPMLDPVAVQHEGDDGAGHAPHVFSRRSIEKWMNRGRVPDTVIDLPNGGYFMERIGGAEKDSPKCPLDHRTIVNLIPQPALRNEIHSFIAAHRSNTELTENLDRLSQEDCIVV